MINRVCFFLFFCTIIYTEIYKGKNCRHDTPCPIKIYDLFNRSALPYLLQLRVTIHGAVAELLLDTDQLVVFRHTVGAAHRTGLYLS